MVLVVGYLVIGRSFAYIGLTQANVFVGEISLVALIANPQTRVAFSRPLKAISQGGQLSLIATLMSGLLLLGVVEFLRGLASGFSILYALRNLPFDYYPLFLFAGMWAASRDRRLLPRATWFLAIANGIYGPIYVLVLSHLSYTLPGNGQVPLFGTGTGSALAVLGLVAHHRNRRQTLLLAGLNTFVLLGNQIRSEWTALIVGLIIWCIASSKLRLLIQSAFCVLLALAALGFSGITIPGANGRGGTVSLGGIFGRFISAVDPAFASKFTADSSIYSSTVSWRTQWWHDILVSSASTPQLRVLGHGYGFPLFSLTTYVPPDTRTPHSVFFYALGYTGWFGVILLAMFWLVLLAYLFQQGLQSGDWFGLSAFATAIVIGSLGDWFETPFGAIPTYLIVGMALAPLMASSYGSVAPTLGRPPLEDMLPTADVSAAMSVRAARWPGRRPQ